MKRVHLKTEVRKEQIANAALDIVIEKGVRSMTVEAVARKVNLAPSALYRHFSGKMALLLAVVELLQQRIRAAVDAAIQDDVSPVENLYNAMIAQAGLMGELQAMPRILFSDEIFLGKPEDRQIVLHIKQVIVGRAELLLQEAMECGEVRTDVDALSLARIFLGLLIPGSILYHATNGEFDTVAHAKEAWKIFYKGIQPE